MDYIQGRLNKIIKMEKKIFILRGFSFFIDELDFQVNKLFQTGIENNIDSIPFIDLKQLMDELMNNLDSGKSYYCYLEEYLLLEKYQLAGYIALKNYDLIIIDLNIFGNRYPYFNIKINKEIFNSFDNFDEDNLFHYLFSYMALIDNVCIIQYGEIINKKITTIEVFQNKFDAKEFPLVSAYNDIKVIPSELSNEKASAWLAYFLKLDDKEIYIPTKSLGKNPVLEYMIRCLSVMGARIYLINEIVEETTFEESEYLNILKRRNENFSFRDIAVYKNPAVNNEKINISQSEIINDIVINAEKAMNDQPYRDIFVTAPTGSGKSVIFQIPAIYLAEKHNLLTIVVSPLIGLMNDQINNIEDLTNLAATINSDYTPYEKALILEKLKKSEKSILYVSPETLLSNSAIQNLIGDRDIGLVVIDEAHTVATWGKSFRPDYWYLGEFIHRLRGSRGDYNFPIATFTATATYGGVDDMYLDIVNSMKMTPIAYVGDVVRNDISFDIRKRKKEIDYQEEKFKIAANSVTKLTLSEEKNLVYFPFISHIEDIVRYIPDEANKLIGKYYGSLKRDEKEITYNKFKEGSIKTILATKAFGMGIDINDINNVYHFAPTGNITDYVQEIGRCARRKDIRGIAISDYYKEDYRYINQLYGMSRIRNYELAGVLRKILHLYRKNKKRNFLAAPEEFSHIFNVTNDDKVDSQLKTALLVIKKDFEISRSINFVPLIFKPRGMYTKGYFLVMDHYIDELKRNGVYNYFKMYRSRSELRQTDGNVDTDYMGDVYELDFRSFWEERYRDVSFASFKYKFYSGDVSEIKLKEDAAVNMIPEMIVDIEAESGDFSFVIDSLYKYMNIIKTILGDYKSANAYFTYDQLANELDNRIDIIRGIHHARMIAESLLNMINNVKLNGFYDNHFMEFNSQTGKFIIVNNYYSRKIEYLCRAFYKKVVNVRFAKQKTFLIPQKSNRNNLKNDIFFTCIQILELFSLTRYEVKSGDRPEFFIRVNSATALQRIVDNEFYQSETLKLVEFRHKESVKLMDKFFGELQTDKERWEFIENYFLGREIN